MSKKAKDTLVAYAFLSPWVIGFLLFTGGPILASFLLSLTNWNIVDSIDLIGFSNYADMFASDTFWNSMKVTLSFTLGSTTVTVLWALCTALLLNAKVKGTVFFQFAYFLPAVIPTVSLAFVCQLIFNKELGVMNYFLSILGINGPNWLYDTSWALTTTVFITIFTYSTGQMMLIFKSSLKEVPMDRYEAASIDGATAIQQFWHITLPSVSPILLFNLVMGAIGTLNNSFSLIFPLTGGGPNGATNVLSVNIYNQAFQNYRMGYASTLAVMLFVVAALLSGLQFLISSKWVHYES